MCPLPAPTCVEVHEAADEGRGAAHAAGQDVAAPADVLGHAVHDYVSAQVGRGDGQGRERVVHHQLQAVVVGQRGQCRQVGDPEGRVGHHLGVKDLQGWVRGRGMHARAGACSTERWDV